MVSSSPHYVEHNILPGPGRDGGEIVPQMAARGGGFLVLTDKKEATRGGGKSIK
jgi:hypothetical protein